MSQTGILSRDMPEERHMAAVGYKLHIFLIPVKVSKNKIPDFGITFFLDLKIDACNIRSE